VTLNGGSVATTGLEAFGVGALGGGSVTLSGTSVSTTGDASKGLLVLGSGSSLTASNLTVTTSGTIAKDGDHADAVFNGSGAGYTAGGTASLTNLTIQTSGANSAGVVTDAGGTTTISGGSVTTSGIGSQGLFVTGAGSSITATGVAVSTSGNFDTSTNSSSNGLDTVEGANAVFSGGSISTEGNAAYAVVADSKGSISLSGTTISTTGNGSGGLGINGSGSEIDASGVTITTTGAMDPVTGQHSYGVYNGPFGDFTSGGVAKLTDTSILTQGVEMFGVLTGTGGATTILGGSIATSGAGAHAILAQNGGAVTVGVSASGPATISTTGTSAPDGTSAAAVVAYNGGAVQLTGATVTTSGAGSTGLVVHGATSSLSASGVTVITTGGIDPATGDHAVGADNAPFLPGGVSSGGFMSLTNSAIATNGAGATGVVTEAGGSTTLIGTNVSTAGSGAPGIFTDAGGVTNVGGGTAGQDSHALFVAGARSQGNLSGFGAFATRGNGAIGIYAALGGVVSAAGSATITTTGGVSLATGLGAYGVNADGAGSRIKLAAANITTSRAGATALYASDAAASGAAGTITATGLLTIKTTNTSADAVALQGNGASVLATGGGSIVSAGTAVAFLGGTNQIATFDNFSINDQTGNLIFADPSVATINLSGDVANAGTNNLLDATNSSAITLNAAASTLTGAIQTDSTSTTKVNLANGTNWTMTGSSTVTNLNVTNSIIIFAPPGSRGAFKTLTVTNYVGNGADIILNAALGGSGSASDRVIVNGGSATGTTLLTIKNLGGSGGQTSGAGIPIVVAINGGKISPDAFSLASTPIVGGFRYTLDQSGQDWFLVSSPTSTVADITNSVTNVAKAQQSQIITNRVLTSILLGATQQINCSSCGSGFASFGSLAFGAQGRWALSDQLTFIGGLSYNQWTSSGISVDDAPTVAGALVYDFVNWGRSRPFVEAGAGVTPYEHVTYSRSYANGLSTAIGNASAVDRDLSLFARVGWVSRLTPIDEAAVYADIGRNWMQTGGYSEATTAINPFPATVTSGLDTLNVARIGAQYAHLFFGNLEANVTGGIAYGFGSGSGASFDVTEFGPIAPNALPNTTWFEYGARIGYRFNDRLVVDAFVLGTAGGRGRDHGAWRGWGAIRVLTGAAPRRLRFNAMLSQF
jgi:hypothetical protein